MGAGGGGDGILSPASQSRAVCGGAVQQNLRVLVYKLSAVVDLVVDDHEQVLLGVVLRDILVGVLLVGHLGLYSLGTKLKEIVEMRNREGEGGGVQRGRPAEFCSKRDGLDGHCKSLLKTSVR